jgi:hypothetical protein
VKWLEGFKLENEEGKAVGRCFEMANLRMSYEGGENKTLNFECREKYCIMEPFVVGIFHEEIREKLESPLCVALIQQENWVRAS